MNIKRKFFLFFVLLAGSFVLGSGTSFASCLFPIENGKWVNVNSSSPRITTTTLSTDCKDPSIGWSRQNINLLQNCFWFQCSFGNGIVTRWGSWWKTVINKGSVKHYVYARYYPGASVFSDRLRVYIWTDYVNPALKDFSSNEWFRRPVLIWPVALNKN